MGNDKAYVLTASYDGAVAWNTIERHQRTMVAEPVIVAERGRYDENGNVFQHYEANEEGKSNALTTVQKDNQVAEPIRVGTMPSPDGSLKGGQAMSVYSAEGKAVTLKSQGGGSGAKTGLYAEKMPECFRVKEATKQGYTDIEGGAVRGYVNA